MDINESLSKAAIAMYKAWNIITSRGNFFPCTPFGFNDAISAGIIDSLAGSCGRVISIKVK